MKVFKGYIFDLDGTIINSLYSIGNLLNKKLINREISPIPIDEYKYLLGDGSKRLVERVVDFVEERDRLDWSNSLREKFTKELYEDFMDSYLYTSERDTKLYDGIKESLDYLKDNGKLIAICTNKPTKAAILIIEELFGPNYFSYIVGVEDGIKIKPDIQMVKIVMDKLNLNKDNTVYFGDTSTDMITAKNAELYAIGVTWGFRDREELIKHGADKIIDNPLKIKDI